MEKDTSWRGSRCNVSNKSITLVHGRAAWPGSSFAPVAIISFFSPIPPFPVPPSSSPRVLVHPFMSTASLLPGVNVGLAHGPGMVLILEAAECYHLTFLYVQSPHHRQWLNTFSMSELSKFQSGLFETLCVVCVCVRTCIRNEMIRAKSTSGCKTCVPQQQ